jgi:RHS repeat-associated protein
VTRHTTEKEVHSLVGLSGPPVGPASFAYDPFGRRASKTVGGATTQFQYDGEGVVEEIQPGVGDVLTNMGFSRIDSAGEMTLLGDLLGNTLALVSDAGEILSQYSYEPFGTTTASGVPSSNPYQFASHQNDGTGLYYYSARYYSPTLGRFISEDPSGVRGGINLYEYAGDQPVTIEDSTGLRPDSGSGTCRQCRAFLRYHAITSPGFLKIIHATHSFWELDDDGEKDTYSGEPSGNSWFSSFLNASEDVDPQSDPLWWSSSGSNDCDAIDQMEGAFDQWPQNSIVYAPFGPNSNSFARYLGSTGGFYPLPPFASIGWSAPIPGLESPTRYGGK